VLSARLGQGLLLIGLALMLGIAAFYVTTRHQPPLRPAAAMPLGPPAPSWPATIDLTAAPQLPASGAGSCDDTSKRVRYELQPLLPFWASSLKALVQDSDVIMLGRAGQQVSYWEQYPASNPREIQSFEPSTLTDVRVERVIKGSASQPWVQLRDRGAPSGGGFPCSKLASVPEGDSLVKPLHEYVFFLNWSGGRFQQHQGGMDHFEVREQQFVYSGRYLAPGGSDVADINGLPLPAFEAQLQLLLKQ
jgi:hypothetical protein